MLFEGNFRPHRVRNINQVFGVGWQAKQSSCGLIINSPFLKCCFCFVMSPGNQLCIITCKYEVTPVSGRAPISRRAGKKPASAAKEPTDLTLFSRDHGLQSEKAFEKPGRAVLSPLGNAQSTSSMQILQNLQKDKKQCISFTAGQAQNENFPSWTHYKQQQQQQNETLLTSVKSSLGNMSQKQTPIQEPCH